MTRVVTVPGDRWACHECGACCRLYELGPVEPAVIAGLRAAHIEDLWPAARDGWYDEGKTADGATRYFLRHVDGHCVFLRADNRCAVHGLLGEAAKPGFCREYPLHVVDRGGETAVVVRPSCAGYHAAGADQPVAEQAAAALALPRVLPVRRPIPAQVEVAPGVVVPWADWAPVEGELLRLATGPSWPALHAVRATLAERFGLPVGTDPERARLAAGAVVEGLRRMMDHASGDVAADPHRRMFATATEAMLARSLPRLGAAAPLSPAVDEWTSRLLHGFLLARWYLGVGGVSEGLAVFALQTWLVRAEAAADLGGAGAVVTRWTKLTENGAVLAFLRRARPALWDLWVNLPR